MTHQEKLTFIRAKCIEANPSIKSRLHVSRDGALRCRNCGEPDDYENHGKCEKGEERPITLADVLLAAEKASSDRASEGMTPESFAECSHLAEMLRESWWATILDTWNLRKDNLDDQDEPTISFLYDVLN